MMYDSLASQREPGLMLQSYFVYFEPHYCTQVLTSLRKDVSVLKGTGAPIFAGP